MVVILIQYAGLSVLPYYLVFPPLIQPDMPL